MDTVTVERGNGVLGEKFEGCVKESGKKVVAQIVHAREDECGI